MIKSKGGGMELKALSRIRTRLAALLAVVLTLVPVLYGTADPAGAADNAAKPADGQTSGQTSGQAAGDAEGGAGLTGRSDPYYSEVLERWKKEGASADHKSQIRIPGSRIAGHAEGAKVQTGAYQGKDNVLIWNAGRSEWIEYEVDVEQGGLYTLTMSYHPFVDSKNRKPIALNITVDGKNPFLESKSIELYRHWKDKLPVRTDDRGDEIRPVAEDISGWQTWELRDKAGAYADALQWYLPEGRHKIRLNGSDPMALESILLQPPAKTEAYAAVRQSQPAAGAVTAQPVTIEAERVQWKSDSSLSLAYDNDIANTPYVQGRITYNTINGERWNAGNQEISWSFDAPETGYYHIAMRAQQGFVSNRSSFRTVLVNGKVPFSELKAYRFLYASGWRGLTLADEENRPYEFYLEKGTNTISMRVTYAPLKPLAVELEEVIGELRKLFADVSALAGGVDDKNRTWDMERDLPGFVEGLQATGDRIDAIREKLTELNGRPDSVSQGLVTARKDIDAMLADADEIPYDPGRLVEIQGKVADQIEALGSQPLQLDRLFVVPAGQPLPKMEASAGEKFWGGVANFFDSFKAKGKWSEDNEEALDVWMFRGRDYVNLLQGLVDEQFTPQTGIKVKVNLLKDEKQLVLMNAAGIAPDVALGMPQDIPFDYAIRGGIYNLKQFPDFENFFGRFAPGSWTPFYYDGGYYGVPETQSFQMMYYRKDILDRLGLKVPDTWEELYRILPVLQQNGMNFTPVEHNAFMQMHGAEYYTPDGTKTGLGSDKSYEAFKMWTDLQNKYAVDQRMDSFYMHFREGSYPIGIADINTYIQLTVAAPELNGLWGLAPVPGVRQADGQVARWLGGSMQSSVIMKNAKRPAEGWEFIKWWTSAAVQERFGTDLETLNGVTFRWNTSNIEAFTKLPWRDDDLTAIMEQWKWFREIPNVPGSYFMERELRNAWTRTVIGGMNYRTSLETAVKEVDREIRRKVQEFGFISPDGTVIRRMNLPSITKPWEGVEPYVQK
ncbi:extracellular solute-binding protein [Paenibacillus caseinilyticus]|uniref:ABC transporter substrate-binding protein n=1 Tax=Paenibacillus mucilaginosus K02 TaxID=997761 RepID=I0BLK6_9BACL|nr:extracellular solute-binding protein [Paenibacillus mucilaginosus]AFH63253.1 ABC transporter substrate-binding protein [Paenibacillus mucilaginosus K02]